MKLSEKFDDSINASFPPVVLFGSSWEPADVLKKLDPTAWRGMFLDWVDAEGYGDDADEDTDVDTEQVEDVVIYDSSLTLEQLKGLWNYMQDEDDTVTFTKEEINQLGSNVDDAIQQIIEDFLNHRGN